MGIPVKTSFKTTAFGVRARELVIGAVAGFISLALLALPLGSIFLRIVLAAGIFCVGLLLAFWRVRRIWTIEEYLIKRWQYRLRGRRFARGGSRLEDLAWNEEEEPSREQPEPHKPSAADHPRWNFPIRQDAALLWKGTNAELAGWVGSVFALVVFLVWIATTGGVATIQAQIRVIFTAWLGHL